MERKLIKQSQPWSFITIDNFLSKEEFAFHSNEAQKTENEKVVTRKILDYDPVWEGSPSMLDEFQIKRSASKLATFTHYANTPPNFFHPIHDEAPFKIMSTVIYLAPEENVGTILLGKNQQPETKVEVKWKPNRALVFCGISDLTWHYYESTTRRYTLNHFIVDPTVIQNPEYMKATIPCAS